jgi:CDP-glycerol glycerophosphotransferase
VRAEPLHRPDVTADADEELANLDWSGFVATVDPDAVRRARPRWEGNWEIGIVVRASGVRRTSWDPAPAPFHPAPVARLSLPGGGHLRADLTSTRGLAVRERRRSVVRSYFLDDAVLQLEGDAGSAKSKEAMLQLKRRDATATLHYPTHVDGSGERTTFLARVPVADLLGELDIADRAAHTEYEGDGIAWDVNLAAGDSRVRLALEEALPETAWTIDGREVGVHRTRHGNFTIVERSFRPVLKSVEWSSDGKLLLGGVFRAPKGSYDLELAARRRGESYGVPLAYEAETGRFSAELKPGALPSFTGPRPLGEGVWELLVRRRGSSRETAVHVLLDHELLGVLPLEARLAHKRFVFGVIGYRMPVLAVGRDLDDGERGGHAQRRLRTSFYRSRREAGLRDVVLYECFGGTEWSDSPLAIHGELVRRQAPFEHLWVVRDGAFRVPDTAVAVRELSEEYYEAYARARYVVGNDYWPWWATRRPEQTWLQTWHGPPLKRLGRELASYPKAVREYRRVLRQPSENWQYVASPSPAATSVLERAFPVSGEVVETGLPRTDILVGPDRERLAESVKRRLGLPADKRVVLYAPTYRDHLRIRDGYRFGPLLDLRALSSALRGDHVLLVRKHRLTVGGLPAEADGVVLDVSAFPDATELLLAVDVLVTDYSSAIFDFAVTRRPIVFFTPDLESYRDEIRGFSIDFEADAPGPLLKTTEEVLEALRQPETIAAEFRERYDAFVSKYCPLADGGVASRLVERLFSW